MWELHENGRMLLLAFATCTNLFLAIIVRMRLAGQSLFPKPVQLTEAMVQQVGLIGNYATLLACVTTSILNFWAGDGSPVIYIACSFFLLLLCDDEMLFFALSKNSFRYFPVMAYACLALWSSLAEDAYTIAVEKSPRDGLMTMVYALPVLPSHVSLLTLLYFGRSRAGLPVVAVVILCGIDVLCLMLSPYPLVQWMAVVGIVGQLTRKKKKETGRKKKGKQTNKTKKEATKQKKNPKFSCRAWKMSGGSHGGGEVLEFLCLEEKVCGSSFGGARAICKL